MDYQGSDRKITFIRSVGFALEGIKASFLGRNMRIHVFLAVSVVIAGIFFSISTIEWLFVLLCIAGIFVLEILNTAIEKTVDLVTNEFHPLAKVAKDLAAGAVLVYAVYSIIVGIIIFLPKVVECFWR